MMTSGMTKGALTMPENKVRPLKRPYRTNTKAANVANTTDNMPTVVATFKEVQNPSIRRVSRIRASYQRKEKPVNLASWRVLLNENTIMNTSGKYKNANTSSIQTLPTCCCNKRIMIGLLVACWCSGNTWPKAPRSARS